MFLHAIFLHVPCIFPTTSLVIIYFYRTANHRDVTKAKVKLNFLNNLFKVLSYKRCRSLRFALLYFDVCETLSQEYLIHDEAIAALK